MTKKKRVSTLYIVFLAIMILMLISGGFMMVYGSLHNGLPMPSLPGDARFARVLPHA